MDIAAVIDNQLFVHTYQILCELEKLRSFTMQNEHNFTLQFDTNTLDQNALIYPQKGLRKCLLLESSDKH